MATTKADVVERGGVSHQQAIVKRMVRKTVAVRKHVIPGGAQLLDNLDKRNLERAIYTWIRKVRWFEDCSLNLVKDTTARAHTVRKVEDFPTDGKLKIWDRADFGKRELSKRMAEYLAETKILGMTIKADGIYLIVPSDDETVSPQDEDWEPHLEFTPLSKGEYSVY